MNQKQLLIDALFIVGITMVLVLLKKFNIFEDYLKFVFVFAISSYYLAKYIGWKLSNNQSS